MTRLCLVAGLLLSAVQLSFASDKAGKACLLPGEHVIEPTIYDKHYQPPELIPEPGDRQLPPTLNDADKQRLGVQTIRFNFILTSQGMSCGISAEKNKKVPSSFITSMTETIQKWRWHPALFKGNPFRFV